MQKSEDQGCNALRAIIAYVDLGKKLLDACLSIDPRQHGASAADELQSSRTIVAGWQVSALSCARLRYLHAIAGH